MLVVCERWVGDGDRLLHIDQHFFLILAGVAQPWVTEGPKPSVWRWLSLQYLVPNSLQLAQTTAGTWLYNCLTFTCFCCSFTYLHRCISWLTAQSRVNMLQFRHLVSKLDEVAFLWLLFFFETYDWALTRIQIFFRYAWEKKGGWKGEISRLNWMR